MTWDLCMFCHFAHDMKVCVFWVCPTTPVSSAGTIKSYIYSHILKVIVKYS